MDDLEHFIRCARRGSHAGASGGEKRAAALAKCVLQQIQGIDSSAVDGLIVFIRGAHRSVDAARELLKG